MVEPQQQQQQQQQQDALLSELNDFGTLFVDPQQHLSQWDSSGFSSLVSLIERRRPTFGVWKKVLFELVSAVLKAQLSLPHFLNLIQHPDLKSSTLKSFSISEILVDVFWLSGLETEAADRKDERERLLGVIKECLGKGLVSADLLKERVELDLLLGVGLIKSSTFFQRKVSRVLTKDTATQQKFNLFREESEGFAKLIVELNNCKNYKSSSLLFKAILGLTGQFDLDPNRVLDVVLDCVEYFVDSRDSERTNILLDLVRLFHHQQQQHHHPSPASSASSFSTPVTATHQSQQPQHSTILVNLVGFKFQYYQHEDVKEMTPKSLYSLAALLIKHELLSPHEIYPHLRPSDEEAKVWHGKDIEYAINAAKKAGRSNVALASEKKGESEDEKAPKRDNQKLGLIEGLLDQADWNHADLLLSRLSCIDPGSHPPIAKALCKRIEAMIEPIYRPLRDRMLGRTPSGDSNYSSTNGTTTTTTTTNGSTEGEGVTSLEELPQQIFPMVRYLGIHVSQNIVLYVKLCRLLVEYKSRFPGEKGVRVVETMLSMSLLPGVTLIPANPGVVNELWEVLKTLPYLSRFKLYAKWKNFHYETYPPLIMAKELATKEIKRIMRRLSKENVRQLGRMLGKVSHNNPIVIFSHIIDQIEAYDNLILPVADAVKYVTNLSYDILSYLIIESLAAPKLKMKSDGTNVSQWLQGLASFSGVLYKKYPSNMELNATLSYLYCQLNEKESSLDLLVLKELISKMSGVEIIEDITEPQLEAFAGGETLRSEAASPLHQQQLSTRNLKKSAGRLRDALIENNLTIPLFVRLTLQRSNVLFLTQSPYLKLVGDLYDKCHETLLQYINFLVTFFDKKTYARILPTLVDLIQTSHLPPEAAFALLRPVISLLFANPSSSSSFPLLESNSPTSKVEKEKVKEKEEEQEREKEEKEEKEKEEREEGEEGEEERGEGSQKEGPPQGEESQEKEEGSAMLDTALQQQQQQDQQHEQEKQTSLTDTIRQLFPSTAWSCMSPTLYATFWSLSLYDIHVPRERYQAEINKNRQLLQAVDSFSSSSATTTTTTTTSTTTTATTPTMGVDSNQVSSAAKKKKEKERYQITINKLEKELTVQEQHYQCILNRINQENSEWFTDWSAFPITTTPTTKIDKLNDTIYQNGGTATANADTPEEEGGTVRRGDRGDRSNSRSDGGVSGPQEIVMQLLQSCIFPRCVFTAGDALYCAKFVQLLHSVSTPYFSTLQCYDKIIRNIPYLLFSCTENEASRLGRFLAETLSVLAKWRTDETTYNSECRSKPGFATSTLSSSSAIASPSSSSASESGGATYAEFLQVNVTWQSVLAKAFVSCLSSSEYMEIRNALLVLIKVVKLFPVWKRVIPSLEQAVAKIKADDKREDLKVLATRYYSLLDKQKTDLLQANNDVLYSYHPHSTSTTTTTSSSTSSTPSSSSSSKTATSSSSTPTAGVALVTTVSALTVPAVSPTSISSSSSKSSTSSSSTPPLSSSVLTTPSSSSSPAISSIPASSSSSSKAPRISSSSSTAAPLSSSSSRHRHSTTAEVVKPERPVSVNSSSRSSSSPSSSSLLPTPPPFVTGINAIPALPKREPISLPPSSSVAVVTDDRSSTSSSSSKRPRDAEVDEQAKLARRAERFKPPSSASLSSSSSSSSDLRDTKRRKEDEGRDGAKKEKSSELHSSYREKDLDIKPPNSSSASRKDDRGSVNREEHRRGEEKREESSRTIAPLSSREGRSSSSSADHRRSRDSSSSSSTPYSSLSSLESDRQREQRERDRKDDQNKLRSDSIVKPTELRMPSREGGSATYQLITRQQQQQQQQQQPSPKNTPVLPLPTPKSTSTSIPSLPLPTPSSSRSDSGNQSPSSREKEKERKQRRKEYPL